jgi:hypothetical protein
MHACEACLGLIELPFELFGLCAVLYVITVLG